LKTFSRDKWGRRKFFPEVPPIEEAAAPNAPDAQQPKQKKRRKKALNLRV
jgi:hypothetical protein